MAKVGIIYRPDGLRIVVAAQAEGSNVFPAVSAAAIPRCRPEVGLGEVRRRAELTAS
jgi:hypothetical protein